MNRFSPQMTALHLAAKFSSGSVVRSLIEAGADVGAQDEPDQKSPLHYAARENPAAVPVLLAANAEVNLLNSGNYSPLFFAARDNHRESVIAILNAGGDPHLGDSPLTYSDVPKDIKDLIKSLSN